MYLQEASPGPDLKGLPSSEISEPKQSHPKMSHTNCDDCGAFMIVPNGTCSLCLACGSTSGCSYTLKGEE